MTPGTAAPSRRVDYRKPVEARMPYTPGPLEVLPFETLKALLKFQADQARQLYSDSMSLRRAA